MMKSKKGSVFIISLIFCAVMISMISFLLKFQLNYHKINASIFHRIKAIQDAESSVQLAMYALKYDSATWTDWTTPTITAGAPLPDGTYTYTGDSDQSYSIILTNL